MRLLLLLGGLLCASTMAIAESHEMPVAIEPAAETAMGYTHHQPMAHSYHHGQTMVRDCCGCWQTQHEAYPPVRYEAYPSRNLGTSYPFRNRPYIGPLFPRFQSWTEM